MSTVTVYKNNHLGERVWQYEGEVMERGNNWLCLQATFQRPDADLGFVVFREGDLFTEWFYSDRWFNVFRVQDGETQRLKGWYCNITRPAVITGEAVAADDLELDVFVMPNGTMMLLDEKEFGALNLPVEERIAALRAVESIRRLVAGREAPFDLIRPDATIG